jgi:ribose 5-phosphate isomerase A
MSDPLERAKELAGRRAAEAVEDGMRVGLGTGSTVHHTILALGERRPRITCVATSDRTAELATRLGLHVVSPDELVALDIAIDGADEVDPDFNLIKGGGGAHTREKIVASMADRFIVVVDESKLVERLGALVLAARVEALGAREVTRRPEPSDNGNVLLDAHFGAIEDPVGLAARLAAIPGLVEHGIFLGDMLERVVVASPDGVSERLAPVRA